MKVKQLLLRDFRNIHEASFYPDPTLNFLIGLNGQGKTSFLEALGLVSTLRSFRDAKIPSLIHWDSQKSSVTCHLTAEDEALGSWDAELRVVLERNPSDPQKAFKTAYVGDKPYRSSVQYLTQRFGSAKVGFHTIVFNPSDHDLVRSEPSIRRSFLDRVIMAEESGYLKLLQKYQRVVEHRNSLLKLPTQQQQGLLEEFNEPYCQLGSEITYQRLVWLGRVHERLNGILQTIAPSQSELRMVYLSQWAPELKNLAYDSQRLGNVHFSGHPESPSLELVEKAFRHKLKTLEFAEQKQGYSLVGPHRDDWGFFFGGHLLKGHGSQGEVRSALLALKLTEIELYQATTQQRPLFLLDDFSSELDQSRRKFLLKFLTESDLQTFITTTDDSPFVGKRYQISQGMIVQEGFYDDRT